MSFYGFVVFMSSRVLLTYQQYNQFLGKVSALTLII